MRVLYLCPGHYTAADGVFQKVKRKAEFWSVNGAKTAYLTYDNLSLWEKALLKLPLGVLRTILYGILFSRLVNRMCKEFQPDLIYTRHFLWPFFLCQGPKLVLEVNGDITSENVKVNPIMRHLIQRSIAYYNKRASGLALVSEQLGQEFSAIRNRVVIPNSILATSTEVKDNFNARAKLKEIIGKKRALCFMATKSRGFYDIEFIVEFIAKMKNPYQLWIIGDIPPESVKNRHKIEVHFLGKRAGLELKKILQESTVAIGCTDFYQGATASPLKTRTYLEHGVPVFSSDFDTDFDNCTPYYRGVPYRAGEKEAQRYTDALEEFLNSPEVKEPAEIEELPLEIATVCLDHREAKILRFFREL